MSTIFHNRRRQFCRLIVAAVLNILTNMPNKTLPGLQKFSKIGFTYPQRSAPVGITKGPSVRLNTIL